MIDAHQHFWRYDAVDYAWITPGLGRLRADFLPPALEAAAAGLGLEGSVAVQARQSLEESRWLLELAGRHPSILGVVGWADLRSPRLAEDLERLAQDPKFKGLRHVVQDEPDPDFMLRPDFLKGLETLGRFKLTYDLLVFPRQLPAAIQVAKRFPGQAFVLDHLAKPPIKTGQLSPWREQLRELAAHSNVCCKLSGMVTEADWGSWREEELEPYMDAALEAFGPGRLMFGSDWPVCLLAGDYRRVRDAALDFVRRRCAGFEERIFGGTAASFYGL